MNNPIRCADEMDATDDAFKAATRPGPKGATVPGENKKRKQAEAGGAEKKLRSEKPAKRDANAYARRWYHQKKGEVEEAATGTRVRSQE